MAKDVIIACDFSSKKEVFNFLDKFNNIKPFVKIGMELFYAEGPEIIRELKKRGHKIFLDLKLHDIPNTVKKAMSVLKNFDIDMCNVHAQGTIKMMQEAINGLKKEDGTRPLLIAVTQLTSTSEEIMKKDLLINKNLDDVVMHYSLNSKTAGLDGVVCSPLESEKVHSICGKDFITVTPGIRFDDDQKQDQIRITTPKKARELGSDYIVVGRPITQHKDPLAAYKKCVKDFLNKEI